MDVILAGMNIDKSLLDDCTRLLGQSQKQLCEMEPHPEENQKLAQLIQRLIDSESMTPETLSAAYARISRDPRPVNQLREDARLQVGKARRSNRSIIFGLGHASVAEHAVFNFDILSVSRYLSEIIQSHRLCSFTEKSQRYIHLDQDFMVPDEIQTSSLESEFQAFVRDRFNDYRELTRLIEVDLGQDPALTAEDARYVLPLCVTTQMGMTINARTLERLLQQAAASPISEYRRFGQRMFNVVDGIAPSVIKYIEGSTRVAEMNRSLTNLFTANVPDRPEGQTESAVEPVRLIEAPEQGDAMVAGAILTRLTGIPIDHIECAAGEWTELRLKRFFKEIFRQMEPWDSAPREFEYVAYLFELIISAAAFAQLKRHRMATLTMGKYDPGLGMTVPPILQGTRGEEILINAFRESNLLAEKISDISEEAVNYAYLACHRRRILMKINARELIHMSRLREDEHAQWDIRAITSQMVHHARQVTPGCMMPACGKHVFEDRRREMTR